MSGETAGGAGDDLLIIVWENTRATLVHPYAGSLTGLRDYLFSLGSRDQPCPKRDSGRRTAPSFVLVGPMK